MSKVFACLTVCVTCLSSILMYGAAPGIWTGVGGGTWNTSAANWSGVAGTPWDITNGPGNTALFATGGDVANLSGTVVPGTIQFNQSATVNGPGVFGFGTTTAAMTVDVSSGCTGTINADFAGAVVAHNVGNKIYKTGLGTLVLAGTTNLVTDDGDEGLTAGYTVEGGGTLEITGPLKAASDLQGWEANYTNQVGDTSSGNSLVVHGSGTVVAGGIRIGGNTFGGNSVTISTPGTQASPSYHLIGINNQTVTLGGASCDNNLTINNGAYLLYSHGGNDQTLRIGVNAGANGNSILVDGAGSTMDRFNAGGVYLGGSWPGATGGAIVVGVLGSSNSLTVSNGGNIHPRRISVGQGGSNNSWTVTSGATGASADGANADFQVGSASGATGNSFVISAGGKYFFNGSSTTRLFAVGIVAGADNNFLQITGANSQFNINNAIPLAIGGTATGNVIADGGNGNHLDILNGGTLVSTAPVVLAGGSATNKTVLNLGNGVGSTADVIVGASLAQSNTYYVDQPILGNILQTRNRWDDGVQTFSSGVSLSTTNTVLKINNGRLTAGQGASMAAAPLVSGVGTVDLGGAGYISIPPGNVNTISSPITGSGGDSGTLSKEGSGTLLLSAANTYKCPTVIKSGTFALSTAGNNNIPNSLLIIVGDTPANSGAVFDVSNVVAGFCLQSGQTLLGYGTVVGPVTINAGGHLAPGNSPGTLTLNGNLTLASGAVMDYELDTPSTSDKVLMSSGQLILSGQQFSDFHFTTLDGFGLGTYTLIDAGSISGNLGGNISGVIGGHVATLAISDNDLVLNVVPEPSTLALLGVGAIGLLGWAYRRRWA